MAYSSITKPTDYFNTVLYTGNGSSQSITGVGHQPDWTWIKSRGSTAFHLSTDSVRGVTKQLYPNADTAENTDSSHITAFNTDGFSVGSAGDVNGNSLNLVSWNWKAGGSASSNSDGSITSSVSANTTAGFSIVSYTGTGSNATVGHGLGAVPKMIIFKDRETSVDWGVYAEPNGNTKEMYLSTADAAGTNTNAFNSTTPTSSVFTIGTSSRYNPSSKGVIAYCFANVKGYSKIGSYTGNGNTDGPFSYTGFKPAWLMIKNITSGSTYWTICDSKRDGFNDNNHRLFANVSDAESTSNPWEMYSNGFKMTTTGSYVNSSGDSYIYMAFAEEPLVANVGNGIPATAR
jgi:hypothetical protein